MNIPRLFRPISRMQSMRLIRNWRMLSLVLVVLVALSGLGATIFASPVSFLSIEVASEGGINVPEDVGQAIFRLRLSAPVDQPVSIDVSTVFPPLFPPPPPIPPPPEATPGASCTATVDYIQKTETITFAPGEQVKDFLVTICDDTVNEPDEAFTVQLTNLVAPGSPPVALTQDFITAVIKDNDLGPRVRLTAPPPTNEGNAGSTNFTFTVTLLDTTEVPVNLSYSVSHGTINPTNDADFAVPFATLQNVNITIPAGPAGTQGTFAIPVSGDTTYELNETFTVTITPVDDTARIDPNNPSDAIATATILNDDAPPTVDIVAPAPQNEGNSGTTPFNFTVNVTGDTAVPIELNYVLTPITANAQDFVNFGSIQTGTLTIPPGQTSGTITIPVQGDTIYENDETFSVTITSATPHSVVGTGTATATILNDDGPPTVNIVAPPPQFEGNSGTTPFEFTVNVTGPETELPINLNWSVVHINTDDADFAVPFGTLQNVPLTIPAGNRSATITIPVQGDTQYEADEVFRVVISGVVNANPGSTTADATILNDDLPTVNFVTTNSTQIEGNPPTTTDVTIAVTLNAPVFAGQPSVSVPFVVTPGSTATAGQDYTIMTPSPLVFNVGEQTKNIVVRVIGDLLNEDPETVILTLNATPDAILGAPSTHVLTIIDDDPLPSVDFVSNASSFDEGDGTVAIPVQLNTPSGRTVTVDYRVIGGTATSNADYVLADGRLEFPAGTTTQNISVEIIDDTISEGAETVIIELFNPVNAVLGTTNNPHTMTIFDNDGPPKFDFELATSSVAENVGTATITVRLSPAANQPVTVDFTVTGGTAVAGTDYTLLTTSPLTFAPGTTEQTINVQIIDNALYQLDRTLELTLSNPSGGNPPDQAILGNILTHTLTIIDNDGPTVSFAQASATVAENGGSINVTLNLSAPLLPGDTATVGFTFGGSAVRDTDFSMPDTITFVPADGTSKTFTIQIIDNLVDEPDKTAVLTLNVPAGENLSVGSPGTFTLTILDNDNSPIAANDTYEVDMNTVLNVPAPGVLANDTDPDGGALTAELVAGPTNGTLTLNTNGSFTYTPNPDYFGADSFTYRARDPGLNASNIATVNIRVNPVNRPPVAVDDEFTVVANSIDNILDVLANDTDPDGHTLLIDVIETQPTNGVALIDPDRRAVGYTPNRGFVGQDSFVYRVCDDGLPEPQCVTATVTIIVTPDPTAGRQVYLPLIINRPAVPPPPPPPPTNQPDLVVESVRLIPNKTDFTAGEPVTIEVVVRNQGTVATNRGFWVDLYINPQNALGNPVTPGVNLRWSDLCRSDATEATPCVYGIAWAVEQLLDPGQTITLTSAAVPFPDPAGYSRWPGYFVAGTTSLYVLVDSWNPGNIRGAIEESDEQNNGLLLPGLSVTGTNPALPSDVWESIAPRPILP